MRQALALLLLAISAWQVSAPAADIKQALSSANTLTVTNLHSLASSATAGWQSAVIDNTSNLYFDAIVEIVLDPANTAPANSKGFYVYMYSASETDYSSPTSGSEGTLTLPDVTANALTLQQVAFIPYVTQDTVIKQTFRISGLSAKWGLAIINHSGAALAASGNVIKWRGVYYTSI